MVKNVFCCQFHKFDILGGSFPGPVTGVSETGASGFFTNFETSSLKCSWVTQGLWDSAEPEPC